MRGFVRQVKGGSGQRIGLSTGHLRWETVQRVLADALLVNAALLVAFVLRFSVLFVEADPTATLAEGVPQAHILMRGYLASSPLVTVVTLTTFALFGFYAHSRAYRGPYKALIIAQAVAVAYLVVATLMYLLFGLTEFLPRPVWMLAGVTTFAFVGGARFVANLWRNTVFTEAALKGRPTRTKVRSVLIIGGAGYIGSMLVRRLLRSGYEVTVLDALLYGDEGIREVMSHPRFRLIDSDFRDLRAVVQSMEGQDAVVHLGGLVGDPACAVDEQLTRQINTTATRMVADVARGFGVSRLVFASSCSVYGASDLLLDERSTLSPVSLYAQTKIDGEQILNEMANDRFAPTNLRFATLYGRSPRARFDLVVNTLTAKAVTDGRITIHGGDQWRPFVHVADVAKAIQLVLEAPAEVVRGETFNVGSDEQNLRIGALADLLAGLVPDLDVDVDADNTDVRNYRVSFARIRRVLGFEPDHTIEGGMRELKLALELGEFGDVGDERFNNLRGLGTTLSYLTRRADAPYTSGSVAGRNGADGAARV
jgi:nucleoside-diphosphate-sugar epimerase